MTRRTSRKRSSLRRNPPQSAAYTARQLSGKEYLKLGDKIVRGVLSEAGYKPHQNFEEDRKNWRQARIDALAALMLDGLDDDRGHGALQERDNALNLALACLDEVTDV
jgi:uncharacterized membrane protein